MSFFASVCACFYAAKRKLPIRLKIALLLALAYT